MSQGHALPATHVLVRRVGSDFVNSFVFHDELAEARGLAVVMTPPVVRATLAMFKKIRDQSEALQQTRPAKLRRPPEYMARQEPVVAHSVSAVFANDSGVVVVGFHCVDLKSTLNFSEGNDQIQIKSEIANEIAFTAPVFLGWAAVLSRDVSEEEKS